MYSKNAELVASIEGGDLDILTPAALFHDVVNYPKNDPRARRASTESAEWTQKALSSLPEYPQEKLPAVFDAISKCSFTNGIIPTLLESKILQDADGLESTGVIAIMRTYASSGILQRGFFHPTDPFCDHRLPGEPVEYALDFFKKRLLKVKERMHTKTGKRLAERRHGFLLSFLDEVREELSEK